MFNFFINIFDNIQNGFTEIIANVLAPLFDSIEEGQNHAMVEDFPQNRGRNRGVLYADGHITRRQVDNMGRHLRRVRSADNDRTRSLINNNYDDLI